MVDLLALVVVVRAAGVGRIGIGKAPGRAGETGRVGAAAGLADGSAGADGAQKAVAPLATDHAAGLGVGAGAPPAGADGGDRVVAPRAQASRLQRVDAGHDAGVPFVDGRAVPRVGERSVPLVDGICGTARRGPAGLVVAVAELEQLGPRRVERVDRRIGHRVAAGLGVPGPGARAAHAARAGRVGLACPAAAALLAHPARPTIRARAIQAPVRECRYVTLTRCGRCSFSASMTAAAGARPPSRATRTSSPSA